MVTRDQSASALLVTTLLLTAMMVMYTLVATAHASPVCTRASGWPLDAAAGHGAVPCVGAGRVGSGVGPAVR
jgi:hypothetical protein